MRSSSGMQPVIGTLADEAVLAESAHLADAVIHAANSDDRVSVETLLGALEGSGKLFIHVSGSSIVADDWLVRSARGHWNKIFAIMPLSSCFSR